MSDLLRELIGRQINVYSVQGQSEIRDSGELVSYDDTWLCLRKDGELLYFSIHRVRLVKPL